MVTWYRQYSWCYSTRTFVPFRLPGVIQSDFTTLTVPSTIFFPNLLSPFTRTTSPVNTCDFLRGPSIRCTLQDLPCYKWFRYSLRDFSPLGRSLRPRLLFFPVITFSKWLSVSSVFRRVYGVFDLFTLVILLNVPVSPLVPTDSQYF